MRLLVLGDIHANWAALSAIDEPFDVAICVGDVVDYGSDPVRCTEWVRSNCTYTVRGNHDHAVGQHIPAPPGRGLKRIAAASRPLHWQLMSDEQLGWLRRLPVSERFRLGGASFLVVHGTPRDPLDEYLRDDARAWRDRLAGHEADFVLVGHTHVPFCLDIGGTTVVNPGSVGQPRDGDPRGSYALIEDGRVELRRFEYDIDSARRHMSEVGWSGDLLEFASNYLRCGGHPQRSQSTASR